MEGAGLISFGPTALQVLPVGALCAIAIAFAVMWLLIGVLVYEDAESRGMTGIGWFLVVLILGLIGLIIYFVVRKDRLPGYGPPASNPWAHAPSYDYRPLAPPAPAAPAAKPPATASQPTGPSSVGRSCPSCEANIPFDAIFCPNCGDRVT